MASYNIGGFGSAIDAGELATGTQGDLLIAGAAGAWEILGTGTSGYFLKSQGAAANPIWAQVSNQVVLVKSDKGSTVNNSEEEVLTHTVGASEFSAEDMIWVEIDEYASDAAGNAVIRLTDGTTTLNISLAAGIAGSHISLKYSQLTDLATTQLNVGRIESDYDASISGGSVTQNMTEANWITTAWTISMRGSASAGTRYFKWLIYRVKSA